MTTMLWSLYCYERAPKGRVASTYACHAPGEQPRPGNCRMVTIIETYAAGDYRSANEAAARIRRTAREWLGALTLGGARV